MTSLFSEHMISVRAAVDSVFGEEVIISPYVHNDYIVSGPTPDNPPYSVIGCVSIDGAILGVAGTRYKAKQDAAISGINSEINFNSDQFSPGKPYPVAGWRVTLVTRAGEPTFRISFVRKDSGGRIHCSVELTTQ